jgi:hypothetical protein
VEQGDGGGDKEHEWRPRSHLGVRRHDVREGVL